MQTRERGNQRLKLLGDDYSDGPAQRSPNDERGGGANHRDTHGLAACGKTEIKQQKSEKCSVENNHGTECLV